MQHALRELVTAPEAHCLHDRELGVLDSQSQRFAVVAVARAGKRPEMSGQDRNSFVRVGALDELVPKGRTVCFVLREQSVS